MRKPNNKQNNKRFIFFIWESAFNTFGIGFFIVLFSTKLLGLSHEEYFYIALWGIAFTSALTLRIATIDEKGITIKMLVLPLKKKLLYNQMVFIGYKKVASSASIIVKDINYSWWKSMLYQIYMPLFKYQGNEKNTLNLLSFIKNHSALEITPISPGAEYFCTIVNAYKRENDVN